MLNCYKRAMKICFDQVIKRVQETNKMLQKLKKMTFVVITSHAGATRRLRWGEYSFLSITKPRWTHAGATLGQISFLEYNEATLDPRCGHAGVMKMLFEYGEPTLGLRRPPPPKSDKSRTLKNTTVKNFSRSVRI